MARVPRGGGPDYSPEERKNIMVRFLKEYSRSGIMTRSADRAGIPVGTVRKWLKRYPKFQKKFEEMRERFVDQLEMVAIERAIEKSDSLMALLLKANRPEKYKENHRIEGDVNHNHAPIQLVFSQDEWGDMPNYVGGATDGGAETEEAEDPEQDE